MRKWLFLVIGTAIAFWFHAGFSAQTTILDFALAFGLAGALFLYGAPVATPTRIAHTQATWGRRPWFAAEYTLPIANGIDSPHLAVDAQNFLYITEPEPASILKLSPAGQEIFRQKLSTAPDLLVKPIGIAVDGQGRIWTTDAQGGSVWLLNPTK